ncbi:MAG: hypothetical protein A3J93_04930 [Candidatus Magasanikbacteria bacterium RIFOXYC2_FULL_42_28]|uniref:Sporulation stage II protein D amidase enhancer LytB N-terminal domain-containing protein n=1 Tax=Candidatus Magasanikbacteria bacterium RIFOXYC2_FULL_42_28 TaxID=1798704 RepID=A0A1F6NWR3_9BACT|nr:MAG: hypothetical protein A3J93_04930 [Candidatus Magasanikbacteria bacterium RIFOXYC2_FULL_42_28]
MKKIYPILLLLAFSLILTKTAWAEQVVVAEIDPFTGYSTALSPEPNIRVGLFKSALPVQFVSDYTHQIYLGEVLVGVLMPGATTTLSYKKGAYFIKTAEIDLDTTDPIRLVPLDPAGYFTILEYKRTLAYKGKTNFNAYRGTLEYIYSPKSKMPWVVNELPLEQYVAGIGETGNNDPIEYIKALLVAARSYGFINIDRSVPVSKSFFDVYATTVDQLYLGYNSEMSMPKVAQAATDTYGQMVTYNGRTVTAPYFANSNGITKTSKQVWGGIDKPWLQPVVAIYDKGKKKYGHGVGMSCYDARARAKRDGWDYLQILQYYYTGVAVEKVY